MRKKVLSAIICCVLIGLVGCTSGSKDVKIEVSQKDHNITEKSERFNEKIESLTGWEIGFVSNERVILKGKKDIIVLDKDGENYKESKVINLNDYKLAEENTIYMHNVSYSNDGNFILLYNQGKDIAEEYSNIFLLNLENNDVIKLNRKDIYENEKDYMLYVTDSGDIYGSDEKNFKLSKENNYKKEVIKNDGYIVGVKDENPIFFDEENKEIITEDETIDVPKEYTMRYASNKQIFFSGEKDAMIYSFKNNKLTNIPITGDTNALMYDLELSENGIYMLSMQMNSLVRNKETSEQVTIPNTNIANSAVNCAYIDNENVLVVRQIFGSKYGEYELYKYNHITEEEVKLEVK